MRKEGIYYFFKVYIKVIRFNRSWVYFLFMYLGKLKTEKVDRIEFEGGSARR